MLAALDTHVRNDPPIRWVRRRAVSSDETGIESCVFSPANSHGGGEVPTVPSQSKISSI